MSFSRIKFGGLSVMDVKTSLGWGSNQNSTLTLSLVQDTDDGDTVSPPGVGTPIYFQLGKLKFNGLLQKWSRSRSPSGFPVYSAICTDPREILDGAQVIINHYNGSVLGVRNVINVYGYYENQVGFGASLANEGGMPWHLVRAALLTICNTPSVGPYGGPLHYRGFNYGLDLSELPTPPNEYRISGSNLLEMISYLCDDGACDFYVTLEGFVIKIKTISRAKAPPLGTIDWMTDTNWGNVLRAESGVEARNEPTAVFLVGGDVQGMHEVTADDILSFWGYDINGVPILGEEIELDLKDSQGNVLLTVETEEMDLNASGVEDIIGDTVYTCTTLEMRLAMVNYDSWGAYIENHRPDVKPFIFSPFKNMGVDAAFAVKPDMIKDEHANAVKVAAAAVNNDFAVKAQRLFEWVRKWATDYYGKRWAVRVPFVASKIDPDNPLLITHSMEPADGGWMEEGETPLGLSLLNADVMKTGDGRFRPFVKFEDSTGVDLARVSEAESVIEEENLFLRANIEHQLLLLPTTPLRIPCVILSLGAAIHDEAVGPVGDFEIVRAVLGMQPDKAQPILGQKFGNVGVKIWPKARKPSKVAVPLKSNTLTYGPWYKTGEAGKVRYEQDQSLTPWNYGGVANMNLAGLARVALAESRMQVSETGTLELAGPPTISLGEALMLGGPNATNIDVSYGKDGVTTSYRFQTYTPRFGVFSKQLAEKIKRNSLLGMELRKANRAVINRVIDRAETVEGALRGFMANAPKAIKRESPHEVILCNAVWEEVDGSGTPEKVRVSPMSLTYEETIGMASPDDASGFRRCALTSMDGIFRPFSTNPSGGDGMPGFVSPTNTTGITVGDLSPYQTDNDISFLAWGNSYDRLNSYQAGNDPANTRAIGLRGPVIIVGWGYDLHGNPVPGDGGDFLDDYLRRSDRWKAGPMDSLWDQRRGCWTSHGTILGTTSGVLPANSSGTVLSDSEAFIVHNPFSTDVDADTTVIALWEPRQAKWIVTSADCEA